MPIAHKHQETHAAMHRWAMRTFTAMPDRDDHEKFGDDIIAFLNVATNMLTEFAESRGESAAYESTITELRELYNDLAANISTR